MKKIRKKLLFFYIIVFLLSFEVHSLSEDLQKIFCDIYSSRHWGDKETISGPGSTLEATEPIRKYLPKVVKNLNIKSILDIPCGDFNWMKSVNLNDINYVGADIIPEIVTKNNKLYGKENILFVTLDATEDCLPKVDLILCRDLFIHLSFENILKTIANFKKCGAKYILTNTYIEVTKNCNSRNGGARAINLQIDPFNFPEPLEIMEEYIPDRKTYSRKFLTLYKLEGVKI